MVTVKRQQGLADPFGQRLISVKEIERNPVNKCKYTCTYGTKQSRVKMLNRQRV